MQVLKGRAGVSALLLMAGCVLGCGGSADTAMYKDNEEATQQHMKEVEDQERAHRDAENAAAANAKKK